MPLHAFECTLLECCGISPNEETDGTGEAVSRTHTGEAENIRRSHCETILENQSLAHLLDESVALEQRRHKIEELMQELVDRQDLSETRSLLSFGVASLLSYVRDNVTGPERKTDARAKRSVCKALELDGEDFVGKTERPELLLVARMILVEPLNLKCVATAAQGRVEEKTAALQFGDVTVELAVDDSSAAFFEFVKSHVPSWLWWAGRTVYVHQQFLRHSSATLRRESVTLAEVMRETIVEQEHYSAACRAQLCLEMAQWEFLYRRTITADEYISKAAALIGVKIELSGALGKRTVHQVDAKAQLIATVHRSGEAVETFAHARKKESQGGEELLGFEADCPETDVLLKPEWNEDVASKQLSLLEQCLALAKSDWIELGTANDDLKLWEMEPFTRLIQSQTHSNFIIQAKAMLSRVKHEQERGRTKERALQFMENLVESVRNPSEKISNRLSFAFCVRLPTMIQLRKQLAEHHVSFGMVSSAIATYEELELWDELVLCYRLLDKKAIADQIVSRQLESDPDSPKLLCTLADLRSDMQLYIKAWEISQCKYPRAQRSLARRYLEKKDYKAAACAFELALELNSLHPDAWFSLGYCYLKLDDDTNALKAFTWCAQLEPENGEAWNNLAALWMRQHKPNRALWALKEAVKYRHSSWETWENYAKASQECGEYFLTIHGLSKVLELTDGKRLQKDSVSSLVHAFLEHTPSAADKIDVGKFGQRLEQFLRKASLGSGWLPENWILFAKVHRKLENPALVQECLMKCFRPLQGTSWKKDPSQFTLLTSVISELVGHYKEGNGAKGDVTSLSLQLRGILKQAEGIYMDSAELLKLRELQMELSQYIEHAF